MLKKAFVLLGATGALAQKKIIPYLDNISDVVLYARRPIETKYDLVIGDLNDFSPLVDFLNSKKIDDVYFYLALPPNLFESTITSINKCFSAKKIHIALEKPFGSSFEEALKITKKIKDIGPEKFYLIDHYLAKETLVQFLNLPDNKRKKIIDLKNIERIHVSILEKEDVKGRATFYDKIGAIKDTGQNHLLNILSVFVNPENKLEILENLKYKNNSLITRQYEGYKNTDGVDPNSKTETYFRAVFDYKSIEVVLENGKAMSETKTFIKVRYKDGRLFELKIKPNPNETKTAHEHIINDFLSGEKKFSLTIEDALASWKTINQVLSAL